MRLTTVRLYGQLGARFGRIFRFALDTGSPVEAMKAIASQVPGFAAELCGSEQRGVRYAVFAGRENIGADHLADSCRDGQIRIAPILTGAKRGGLFQVVIGAALIGLAAANPAFLAATGAFSAAGVGAMGVSLALGGIVQILSPQQKGLSAKDSPENGASYNFNGPVNTRAQGNPVPIGYGEMIIGSAVISAGIYAEDQT
jgi:predicted phage tail protein